MTTDTTAIRTYFAKLGLEAEIADIYLALHGHGPQTISALARSSGVERTRIYRLIDQLLETNLIELDTAGSRGIMRAAPIANLQILIHKRQQDLRSLQDELQLVEQVLGRNSLSSPVAKLQLYQGESALEQLFWNQTLSKTAIRIIWDAPTQFPAGGDYRRRWQQAVTAHAQPIQVISASDLAEPYSGLSGVQRRLASPSQFPIQHTTVYHDDVTTYINNLRGESYAVELTNRDITQSGQTLFDRLWQQLSQ